MSGYEVVRQVRENGLADDVVLVALTGYGRDIQAAKAAGFDAHVTKPADPRLVPKAGKVCAIRTHRQTLTFRLRIASLENIGL